MNAKLTEPFTVEEVRRALFQMHPKEAPGVDDFPALFYQRFWELVKDDVCKEVLKFLNHGILDTSLNMTQIIIMPKKEEALKVTNFCPISLCNVSMKIITKVMANRLCECLPLIISKSQSAFIKGRLITDNILVAHEASHCIRQ